MTIRPAHLMSIIVFTLPWAAVVTHPELGTITRILGGLLVLPIIGLVALRGHFRFPLFAIAAMVFLLWCFATVLWSIDASLSFQRNLTIMMAVSLGILLSMVVQNDQDFSVLIRAYALGTLVTAVEIIRLSISQEVSRVSVGFDPNEQAIFLSLGILFAARLSEEESRIWAKALFGITIFVGGIAILLTGSRAGAVALLLTILYLASRMTQSGRWRVMIAVGFIGILSALILVPDELMYRLLTTNEEIGSGTFGGRGRIWVAGFVALGEAPFLGSGIGTFPLVTEPFLGFAISAHNDFLGIAVEAGLVGLVLWLVVVGSSIMALAKIPSSERNFWFIGFLILTIGLMTLTLRGRPATWMFLALCASVAANHFVKTSERSPDND